MNKNLTFLLLIFSVIVNILFISYFVNHQELFSKSNSDASFSFYESGATYTITKNETGTYGVKYSGKDGEKSLLVGSAQYPLDEYADKKVQLNAEVRPIYGNPTCYRICDGTYNAPVIDIKKVELVN